MGTLLKNYKHSIGETNHSICLPIFFQLNKTWNNHVYPHIILFK
jgi:hypothetical protein